MHITQLPDLVCGDTTRATAFEFMLKLQPGMGNGKEKTAVAAIAFCSGSTSLA